MPGGAGWKRAFWRWIGGVSGWWSVAQRIGLGRRENQWRPPVPYTNPLAGPVSPTWDLPDLH